MKYAALMFLLNMLALTGHAFDCTGKLHGEQRESITLVFSESVADGNTVVIQGVKGTIDGPLLYNKQQGMITRAPFTFKHLDSTQSTAKQFIFSGEHVVGHLQVQYGERALPTSAFAKISAKNGAGSLSLTQTKMNGTKATQVYALNCQLSAE